MAGHAGLQRQVKTVHGKHGTIQRAYWIARDPRAHQQAQAASRAADHGTHDARILAVKRAALMTGMTVAGAIAGSHVAPLVAQVGTASLLAAATALQHGAAAHHIAKRHGNGWVAHDPTHSRSNPPPVNRPSKEEHREFVMESARRGAGRGMSNGLRLYGSNKALMGASRVGGAVAGAYIGSQWAASMIRDTTPAASRRSR